MKKYFIGVDISKQKLDVCVRSSHSVILECQLNNSKKVLPKSLKSLMSKIKCDIMDVLICCEYTGMYINPLIQSCNVLELDLWIEDPTQIKYSFGV